MPKAVVCRELGPPERLRLETFDAAPLDSGQVRVAIRAAGINFPQQRPEQPRFPASFTRVWHTFVMPRVVSMTRLLDLRCLWFLVLLTAALVALIGHPILDAAAAAPADSTRQTTRLTLSTGCLHTSVLLPGALALPLGLVPHCVLSIAPPILHGYCAPTPLRPPTSSRSL